MRCKKATEFILIEADGVLSAAESRDLEAHLAGCEVCRALRSQAASAFAVVSRDAEVVSGIETPAEFAVGLHDLLVHEQKRLSGSLALRIGSAVGAFQHRLSPAIRRLLLAAAGLALFLVLFAATQSVLLRAPIAPDREFRVGHVASLAARPGKDGRVYAVLIERSSRGRDRLNGDIR